MQYTRSERLAQGALVLVALVFAIAVGAVVLRGGGSGSAVVPTGTPAPRAPAVKISQDPCCAQTARFLSASWAELHRVQWPDRRQVTQATAVVLGFVAIAGLYLGLADFVAKEIVEFVL